jgi:CRP/FNR family cyclic AMP-dependent transcriptional regulator
MALSPRRSRVARRSPLRGAPQHDAAFNVKAFLHSEGLGNQAHTFHAKETVFAQGDPASHVLFIEDGAVKLTVVSESGKQAVVGILGSDDFFGEACLAGQSTCPSTATAIAPTTALVIGKDEMVRLLHGQHEFYDRFIAYVLARNIRIEADLTDHIFNSSEKRLARTLLTLARYGARGGPHKTILSTSQETLAEMIGTTRPRVNFFMNKFRKLGFIQYSKAEVHVNPSLLNVVVND